MLDYVGVNRRNMNKYYCKFNKTGLISEGPFLLLNNNLNNHYAVNTHDCREAI